MEKKVCIGIKNELKKYIRKYGRNENDKELKKEWKREKCLARKIDEEKHQEISAAVKQYRNTFEVRRKSAQKERMRYINT